MEVEGDIRPVDLVAAVIGTGEVFLDFYCQSAVLLTVLELVQLEVLILQVLGKERRTSRRSTSLCSCAVLSETSLIREKLSSFLRYVFQNS